MGLETNDRPPILTTDALQGDVAHETITPEQAPDALIADQEQVLGAAIQRRALIYLGCCLIFSAILLVSMLYNGAAAPTQEPCAEGAVISQAAVLPAGSEEPPHLLAVVRPPLFPNQALGNEPGCAALYRSDDNGITWTVAYSATVEAPMVIANTAGSQVYLLTQLLHFPLYLNAHVYRSDNFGGAWTWVRVSPQKWHDVPLISVLDMAVGMDGLLLLREGNGDGAAVARSRDGRATWQSLAIPHIPAVAGMALVGRTIGVVPPVFMPGQSPGMRSRDEGVTWQPMGLLPQTPQRAGMHAEISAYPTEGVLILELQPDAAFDLARPLERYGSADGGRSWHLVRCGPTPSAGCAPTSRWVRVGTTRYVLYHKRIFRRLERGGWTPLPITLPVPSSDVLQVLAAPGPQLDRLYLVTPQGLWRWAAGRWQATSTGLALSSPTPTES